MKFVYSNLPQILKFTYCALFTITALISCDRPEEIEAPEYGWFEFVIPDLDTTKNVVDMSFLNSGEAGSNGYVTIKDGHFVDGDGKPVRFFGTNLTFSSAFPDKETAKQIAARLSKLGYNVLRFHHLDMRSSPDGIWNESQSEFNTEQVDKLDWLIYQLKKKGIYTNLNLHVSYTYPGVDYEINHFNFGKSIDIFYRPYIEMQKEYARNLLTHENPYTGTTYTEEPAIAFVEINNENSLLSNWRLLPQLNNEHREALVNQWTGWLNQNNDHKTELGRNTDLMRIIEVYDSLATESQKEAMWAFLKDTEMAYTEEMTDFLKNELNVSGLISMTQASYSGAAGVLREATFADFIDMHAYWEHPRFPGESWSRTNWLIRNSSMVADKKAGTLARFGMHRVSGMPLTISEYDHPAPNYFCAEMYPMLNSVAAFQNWDGIYHFTFNGPWERGYFGGFFSSSGHPLKQIFLPVGAAIFRMDAVRSGDNLVTMQLPEKSVVDLMVESGHNIRLHRSNMDKVWEQLGAPAALPLLRPMEVSVGGESLSLSESIDEPSGPWVSETGELSWDNRDSTESVFTINAPAVKGAIGYIGGKDIQLEDVSITMDTTEFNWGSVVMTTLDSEPIANSSRILLVSAGGVENTGMEWNEEHTTVGGNWGTAPTMAEGIPVIISFNSMDEFRMYILDPAGNKGEEVNVVESGNEQKISIGAQHKTLWYLLERD